MKVMKRDFMEIIPDETYKKLYKCKICGKYMKREYSLKIHVLNHLNIKRFECEVCHKRFNSKTYLSDHSNTHTGLKPYVCDIGDCKERFRQRIKLCVHKREVHGFFSRATPKCLDKNIYGKKTSPQEADALFEVIRNFTVPGWIDRAALELPEQLREGQHFC